MMFSELSLILAHTTFSATRDEIAQAVVGANVLGKPTQASRKKSLAHLIQLYGLDPSKALFRVLRRLADMDPASIPQLAIVCAYCRDSQLRASFALIRSLPLGEPLERPRVERFLEVCFPNRFSKAMLKSLAQNTSTSWTVSGHLTGRAKKFRSAPPPRPVAVAYALLAGYLAGLRGQRLLTSEFSALASPHPSQLPNLLGIAAARGLLGFKHAGGVVEFDFSPLLTADERALADESH